MHGPGAQTWLGDAAESREGCQVEAGPLLSSSHNTLLVPSKGLAQAPFPELNVLQQSANDEGTLRTKPTPLTALPD